MAIQQRRGAKADFDVTKMLPGELAVTTDGSRKVYVAFAPGDAKELASTEEVEEIIQGGIEEIEQKKEEALAQFPNYEDKIKELEIYKANSIISTSSGTVFHESDCAAVPPINIKLFGKGKQRQYEGTNLVDLSLYTFSSYEINGLTFSLEESGMRISGTIQDNTAKCSLSSGYVGKEKLQKLSAGIYSVPRLYVDGYDIEFVCVCYDENDNHITSIAGAKTTINSDFYVKQVIFYVNNAITSNIDVIIPPQLNAGSVFLKYEPYVGGEQSPNMKYPQKAEFLGESGSIGEKVLTENLFDVKKAINTATGTLQSKTYFKFENGEEYTISLSSKEKDTNIWVCASTNNWNDSLKGSRIVFSSIGELSATFTIPNDGLEYHLYLCDSGTPVAEQYMKFFDGTYMDKLQIKLGSLVTDYEPYTEQPFTALTPNGLRGIPLGQTIPDAIKNSPIHMNGVYWDGEQYQIADTKNEDGKDVQRIDEYILNDENWYESNGRYYNSSYKNIIKPPAKSSEKATMFCNQLFVKTADETYVGKQGISIDSSGTIFVRVSDWLSSLTEWKNHLSQNPITINVVLANPIITATTDQYDVVMNYPNTTIVNDAGAYMEVEYVADTKKHIEQNYVSKEAYNEHENRIAELEKAIVNS